MIVFSVRKYHRFINEWHQQSISVSEFLRSLGYESAVFIEANKWGMDEADYTMFLLRWE